MQKNMEGIITSSGLLLFSSVQELESEEKPPKVAENIIESLRMQTLSHAMHIQLFRLEQKDTSNRFPSNFVLSLKWTLAHKKFVLDGVHLKACCFLRWRE